jgi:transcriptional regulator with XRE-family HTH domain
MTTTAEQRRRGSRAVRERMNDLGLTVPKLAKDAGVNQSTIRALLAAQRWPRAATRQAINHALGWPMGELARRAASTPDLRDFSTSDLLAELCRRAERGEQMPRAEGH